jgi:predicted transcriptional regulator YheO
MANKYVNPFLPLVDALAETFGKNCEVVLHDFSKPEHSIIKIANGHVTGRDVGGPVTDLVLSMLKKNSLKKDSFVGYGSKTKKGTGLKSTTVFIRNNKDKIVGALCINIDVTPYLFLKNVLEGLCSTSPLTFGEGGKEFPEKFEPSVDALINELVEQSVKNIGKPAGTMGKEDKLQVIRSLKEKGLFLIKGSAKRVAQELNVSLATIYKYLEEIQ